MGSIKKMILIAGGILIALIVVVASCSAMLAAGGGDSSTTKSKGAGSDSKNGYWAVVDDLGIKKEVQPKREKITGDFTAKFTVKNVGDSTSTPYVTVLLKKGSKVVGSLDCSGPDLEPGESGELDCLSTDDYTEDYDTVTVKGLF